MNSRRTRLDCNTPIAAVLIAFNEVKTIEYISVKWMFLCMLNENKNPQRGILLPAQ